MEIKVLKDILGANEQIAQRNRRLLDSKRVFAINLMSSPGAGKTSLILKTIRRLEGKVRIGVIEGDVSSSLDAEKISEPHAVVLYGKARWIGPLFKGEEITEYNLASVLFVVGADCECGFDYRWLQGTMLPARWDEKRQAQIAENLGFDPENPMIKSEMSWIIGRGYSSYPRTPFGYQELVIEPESPNDVNETLPDPVDHAAAPEPNTAEPVSAPEPLAESAFRLDDSLRYVMYILIGLSALILVAGVVVLVRAKRK